MKMTLLFLPCLLAIAVPLFNTDEPRLFGLPFFYWGQVSLVPLSAFAIYGAFRLDRAKERIRERARGQADQRAKGRA